MPRRSNYCYGEVLPFAALVSVECTNVGMNTLYKAAVAKGLSFHVYMVYASAISSAGLLPLVFIFHRKTRLPPMSFILLCKFCFLGFLGFTGQYAANLGIKYSSPTMGSAMSNLAPACTFFLAILFRMEKLELRSTSSLAKVIGALASITGALIVVFYYGPSLIRGEDDKIRSPTLLDVRSNWILGGALNAACYVTASLWYIFQSKFFREYPAEFVFVFFYNLTSFILALSVGIALEPNLSSWKLAADIRTVSVLYTGIIGMGYGIMIHTWGLHVKGPLYVALFRPLSIAIAAIMGVIFLGEGLYLGTVIGSAVITMGFYMVVWGKYNEEIDDDISTGELRNDGVVPLLKNHENPDA